MTALITPSSSTPADVLAGAANAFTSWSLCCHSASWQRVPWGAAAIPLGLKACRPGTKSLPENGARIKTLLWLEAIGRIPS